MGKVDSSMRTGTSMKETGLMTKLMVKECMSISMVRPIRGRGERTSSMALEQKHGQTGQSTKANMFKDSKAVMANSIGLMDHNMKVSSLKIL